MWVFNLAYKVDLKFNLNKPRNWAKDIFFSYILDSNTIYVINEINYHWYYIL